MKKTETIDGATEIYSNNNSMNRIQSFTLYGIIIVVTGIIISSLAYNPSRTIQYIVAAGLFLSSFFALVTAYKSKSMYVPLRYHALQGFGLLVYAITVIVYANTLGKFLTATSGFLLYFGLTEIILGFQLSSLDKKIKIQLIVFRLLTGFLTVFLAVLILATSVINPNNALLGSGIAFILGGTGFILFANFIRKSDIQGESSQAN